MSLKIFIDTGLANEGTGTVIDNGQSDKIEASYNNGRVSITVLQEQGMGARDYRMTPKARYTVNALKNISMYYDGRLINVPALLLLNSWSNSMAELEGVIMWDRKYYEGYEGEGEVKIWLEENGNETGIVVWDGFFNTILEGCFSSKFHKDGIVECYYNQDGFYDGKWEMKYSHTVLEELKQFNEKLLDIRNESVIKTSQEVIERLVSLINRAIISKNKIYIEYE